MRNTGWAIIAGVAIVFLTWLGDKASGEAIFYTSLHRRVPSLEERLERMDRQEAQEAVLAEKRHKELMGILLELTAQRKEREGVIR